MVLRGGLGLLGVATVVMGLIAAFWLPANGARLDQQKNRLHDSIARYQTDMRTRLSAHELGHHDANALPPADALAGEAGELLAEIGAAGARQLGYELSNDTKADVRRMNLTVTFLADVNALGAILDRVALKRPAVSMHRIDLDRDDDGRIEATLGLYLLGQDNA